MGPYTEGLCAHTGITTEQLLPLLKPNGPVGKSPFSFVDMQNFVKAENRAIDRKQMELIAGRVSSVNECFY